MNTPFTKGYELFQKISLCKGLWRLCIIYRYLFVWILNTSTYLHTVGKKVFNKTLSMVQNYPNYRRCGVGQGQILPLEKWIHFFLGPWLLVCQFIEISNQMELTGEVSNFERIFLYNRALYKFFCSKFETSPVSSI